MLSVLIKMLHCLEDHIQTFNCSAFPPFPFVGVFFYLSPPTPSFRGTAFSRLCAWITGPLPWVSRALAVRASSLKRPPRGCVALALGPRPSGVQGGGGAWPRRPHHVPSVSPPAAAFPVTTPEPLVLVTPPRCLTANRTQQGVLLSWLPPANHSFPIDRYIMEYRVGEHWETLDGAIPGTEGDFFAKDLSQVRGPAFPKF